MIIELTEQEVANLMQILTTSTGQPWVITHPLIMKIGQQQGQQQAAAQQQAQPQAEVVVKGYSHDPGSDFDQERSAAPGGSKLGSTRRNTMDS